MKTYLHDPVLLMFLGLTLLRLTLFVAMTTAAVRLMYDMATRRCRRRGNPALRHSLMLIATSGVGFSLLVIRQLLIRFDEDGTLYWLLFNRDPDVFGELGSALLAVIAVGGILLLIRGARAILYPGESGELPRGLRSKNGRQAK